MLKKKKILKVKGGVRRKKRRIKGEREKRANPEAKGIPAGETDPETES